MFIYYFIIFQRFRFRFMKYLLDLNLDFIFESFFIKNIIKIFSRFKFRLINLINFDNAYDIY